MRVYLTGAFEHMDTRVGFGNAAYQIYQTMRDMGVDVHCKRLDDDSLYDADIEICFDQPQRYKFMCPTSYKIGYTPWESTEFMPSWHRPLAAVDEVWTPSSWNTDIFSQKLTDKTVFTYRHGIDHRYRPKKRKHDPDKPFTFLFVGEPYWRKDGDLVARTFASLFGNNPAYRLIVKCTHISTLSISDRDGKLYGSPEALYDNIFLIRKMLPRQEMLMMYDEADVFVYPSWGEGFGFNPLQAMAMGIPTISTYAWSDYKEHITAPIDSEPFLSPWQDIHPGYMLRPSSKQFTLAMSTARDNHEEWSKFAFKHAFMIHEQFDWHRVTEPAVKRLQKISESRELKAYA